MRTSVKAPIIILSALTFLAGCKSYASKAGQKTGYLHSDNDSVMFVEWAQIGRQIEGTMEKWGRKPGGKVGLTMFMFDGVLDGENVSLTLNTSWTSQGSSHEQGKTIKGTLRGDALTLPPEAGAVPIEFRRASREEFVDAYLNLHKRAMTKKGAK